MDKRMLSDDERQFRAMLKVLPAAWSGRVVAAEMGVGGEKFQLGTVGALGLSVVSSVSIVICNKALMSSLGFTFVKRR
ncbi:hypothetical protein TRIUR3_12621 [Triticum urartu]|uniref:Uncharacterized protein n=1 Tax=Triticum urartu TaxID=4572 RepID=M7ZWX4_TRIUA|nr:hypothetical protein TRIUR3_12621 [Triticum urartu]